jgi:hypothetical protein
VRIPGYKAPVLSFVPTIALKFLVEMAARKESGVSQVRQIKAEYLVRSPFDVRLVLSRVLEKATRKNLWPNPSRFRIRESSNLLAQHDQTSERRVDRFSRDIQGFYGIYPSKSAGRRGPCTCGLQGHHEMSGTYVGDRCGCSS